MEEITVVSGLPRSGTSMMMAMLQAAGLELLVDHVRSADQDNPRGYYEYEKVKRLRQDASWLHEAQGKTIKVVSSLLEFLPPGYRYRVIFMQRTMAEVLMSQNKMLARNKQQAAADDEKLAIFFINHLRKISNWLAEQKNFTTCAISFNRLFLPNPEEELARVAAFCDGQLDLSRMLEVIDKALYRQKEPTIIAKTPPHTACN